MHVGLPRCASSSLQDWAGTNSALLAQQGIVWPEVDDAGLEAARHQWLVEALKVGSDGRLERVLADHGNDDILISSEGLSLQFDHFPTEQLDWFRQATAGWEVRLILMTREILDWQRSMWKQCMVNPVQDGTDFGLSVDMADFGGLPRIRRLMDIRRLSRDMEKGFGAKDVTVVSSDGDWLTDLARLMDLDLSSATMPPRRQESLPDAVIEIVRAINAEGTAGGPREGLLALLQMALDTRSDSLRELLRQKGPLLAGQIDAVAEAMDRVAKRCSLMPATRIAIETMIERLAELGPAVETDRI